MRLLRISLGAVSPAVITKVKSVTWDAFSTWLTREPPQAVDKAERGWYIPATFEPAYRDSDNFIHRDALTFDFDHVTIDTWGEVLLALEGTAFAIYTTYSHTDVAPRFRVVVPLSRPAGYDEFQAVARKMAQKIGIELVARESFVPTQMMYSPARKSSAPFISSVGAGPWLDVDAVLAQYENWTDAKSWPRRRDGDPVHCAGEAVTPPDEKPGIVGAFCRTFRIADAIAKFQLPYTPTNTPDRWTYTEGSRPEGAIEYDNGLKFHSHHDTDPARGQHNAYDLVRLHKFGHLDASGPQDAAINDRPSARAMADFVGTLEEVAGPGATDQYQDIGAQPALEGQAQRFLVQSAATFSCGPPADWVVRGVLPRAELAVIYGESGCGKSFLALDLCAAITRGITWREKRTTPGRVIYVCAEGAGGFKSRLRAYAKGHRVALGDLPDVIADAPNMLEAKDAALITSSVEKWGKVDVVVIDTLSATTPGGNENSGEDMGRVLSHCKSLHRKTGALVVLIHHSGKDATKGARGWSGLRAAADAEIEITRHGDFRTATVTKMKDGDDGAAWPFKLKPLTLGVDQFGEEESSCVVEHTEDETQEASTKARPQGANQVIAYQALKTIAPVGSVYVSDLYAAIKAKMPPSSGSKRHRPDKALTDLIAKKLAFMHGTDRVSLTSNIKLDEQEWMQ